MMLTLQFSHFFEKIKAPTLIFILSFKNLKIRIIIKNKSNILIFDYLHYLENRIFKNPEKGEKVSLI